jgi:ferredoxin-fold anticodon binding domain-containing protein
MKNYFDKKISIGGLPYSYDSNYVLRTEKQCGLCMEKLEKSDIEHEKILFTDEFSFVHKECLKSKKIDFRHIRENDINSPVILSASQIK